MRRWTERAAMALVAVYAVDRALKFAAVAHFFRRAAPPAPHQWPSLALVQPVTRGATDLAANLRSRLATAYPGTLSHVVVCDAADHASLGVCRDVFAADGAARIVAVEGEAPASKIVKIQAALPYVHADVVCFVDDDIALRPGALDTLVRYLVQPGAGAVFGLAAYVWWRDVPSSLMGLFVNHNALASYVPLTYLTPPFTITGHCYAVRGATLEAAGAFGGMKGRIDDDHDLARQIRKLGLRNVQTPVIYDVSNALPTWDALRAQLKRWFVFPRQCMVPYMTGRERAVSALGSAGMFVPGVLATLALTTRRRGAWGALVLALALAAGGDWLLERRYLGRRTPSRRWLLHPLVVAGAPFGVLWALLSDDTVEWRGQHLWIERGGTWRTTGDGAQ
jgi:ceramide glucosyltransferase